MARQQQTFTTDFKREAVRLVEPSGKGLTQVAHGLGITDSTLSHWGKQLSEKGAEAFPGRGESAPAARTRPDAPRARHPLKPIAIFTRGPL